MGIPAVNLSIIDPGLGLAATIDRAPVVMGVSTSGTKNQLYAFSRLDDVKDTLGQGPLADAVGLILANAGGPVRAIRTDNSVAAANGSVTVSRVGSSTGTIAVTGSASDNYEAILEVTATGASGTGRFRYSLDDGRTFSPEITIPSGGSYVLTDSGLTITFTDGAGPTTWEDGDTHSFDTTCAHYNATDLAAAFTALKAVNVTTPFILLAGKSASTSDGATLAAAVASQMTALENVYRYAYAWIDAGDDTTTNAIADFASFSSARVGVTYGYADQASPLPITGKGFVRVPISHPVAARDAASLVSTDLGRVASGALPGIAGYTTAFGEGITHDEFRSELLDSQGFTTLRTIVNQSGYFVTNGRIKAPVGSDFQLRQYRQVVDLACTIAHQKLTIVLNSSARTNSDGTIFDGDAKRIENGVNESLRAALLDPTSAEGTRGHVSAAAFTVDRLNNFLTSNTIIGNVAVRPLGYGKTIDVTVGFVGAQ